MASEDGSAVRFPRKVTDLFNSRRYSDLKIQIIYEPSTTPYVTFYAHKAIVCTQSKILEDMCNSEDGPKDPQESVIKITKFPASAIAALLEYFYRHDYREPADPTIIPALPFHVIVYIAGENYQVPGLKQLATKRFQDAATKGMWDEEVFLKTVPMIYYSGVPSDSPIRNAVVKMAKKNFRALQESEIFKRSTAWSIPNFSMDVAKAMDGGTSKKKAYKSPIPVRRWKCLNCHEVNALYTGFIEVAFEAERLGCSKCHTWWTISSLKIMWVD